MATGTEHYQEAERLVEQYRQYRADHRGAMFVMTPLELSEAQVHATLAVGAAVALGHVTEGGPLDADRSAWIAAASEHPAQQRRAREADRAELAEYAAEQDVSDDDLDVFTTRPGPQPHGGLTTGEFDSYVRITHRPTGITVERDSERSQLQNKANALAELRRQLAALDLRDMEGT
jgi:peptide chain release factor 2